MARRGKRRQHRRVASDAKDVGIAIIAVTNPHAAAIMVAADKGQKLFRKYFR